ncbi:MAG TPA: alpha-L-rhamnosidase C-terminal domain-containing protein [Opitutaceae bacterium]|nr:alpha-L-rhamnosidase C-terminal domain-containing protein [Opitutaceae bacterium]
MFAHFRLAVHLAEDPASARLNLFADTRYRLRVNGAIVSCGPAAFLVAHPEYDTIDLAPWLHLGDNVITVEVNSRGDRSFQAEPSRGGFLAWGRIEDGGTAPIDLATPGDWRVRRAGAWLENSPVFSFVQGPVEIADLRALPADGSCVDLDAPDWRTPIVAANPAWGEQEPRSIAPPTFDLWTPTRLLMLAPLRSELAYLSAQRVVPTGEVLPGAPSIAAVIVWLHSPRAQQTTLSLFAGSYWINGVALAPTAPAGGRVGEERAAIDLRAGWNLLYGECRTTSRTSNAVIAWPIDAGLRASADPGDDTALPDPLAPALWLSYPLGTDPSPAAANAIPHDSESARACLARWDFATGRNLSPLPAREVGWDRPDAAPVGHPEQTQNREIPRSSAGEGFAVFDFGREFIGHVQLEIDAPEAGILDVANEELQQADGAVRMLQRGFWINPVDRLYLRKGRNVWTGFHARGGRLLQLTARSAGPVVVRSVALRNALVKVAGSGTFACSDDVLNWAWDTGIATLEASLTDGWIDPWREQGLYVGDTLVQYLAHRAWSRDTTHIRRALRLWGRSQTKDGQILAVAPAWPLVPHADYTLIWILIVRDYVEQTGDRAFADELWPVVERIWSGSRWRPGSHGLWTGDDMRVFCDWGAPQDSLVGEANGVLNAFRVGALEATVQLANWRNDDTAAARYSAEREKVVRAYRDLLWDPARQAFAASLQDGRPGAAHHAHANALALRYGIATPDQEEGALRVVRASLARAMDAPEQCQRRGGHYELYFLHYVLEMLGARGLHEEAEAVIRRFWGLQREHGAWCLWEAFYRGLRGTDSQCHGWAAGPSVYFHRTVLGIAVSPARIVIEPNAHGLAHAQGVHPHPRGDIRVAWRVDGGDFHLDVELPEGLAHDVRPGATFAHLRPRVNVHTRIG